MADFGGNESNELAAFRAEAREWLEANYPAALRKNPAVAGIVWTGIGVG